MLKAVAIVPPAEINLHFIFFAGAMLLCAVLFIPVAIKYREKIYVQKEQPDPWYFNNKGFYLV